MIYEYAQTCDIVQGLGVPETTVRNIKRNKKNASQKGELMVQFAAWGVLHRCLIILVCSIHFYPDAIHKKNNTICQ